MVTQFTPQFFEPLFAKWCFVAKWRIFEGWTGVGLRAKWRICELTCRRDAFVAKWRIFGGWEGSWPSGKVTHWQTDVSKWRLLEDYIWFHMEPSFIWIIKLAIRNLYYYLNPYQDLWRCHPTNFFIENRQSFQMQFLTSRETAWCSKLWFHIKFTSSGEKIIGIITISFFTTPCAKNNSLLRFLFWTFSDDIFQNSKS